MKKFLGIAGLVLFAFGITGGFFSGDFGNLLVLSHLILGLALAAVWVWSARASNIDEIKTVLMGRRARFGAMASAYSVLALGILIVLNVLVSWNDKKWDLTEQGVYSLAEQSTQAVKSLTAPLYIAAFQGVQAEDGTDAKELLERYRDLNPGKVSLEFIDPRIKPQLIEKYEMKEGNLIYLAYGAGDKKSVSRLNDASEEAITNAILKLSRGAAKKVYYVVGHDEPSLKSGAASLADALGDENYTVSEIVLGQNPSIPSDAAAVILCAPKMPLLKEERDLLIRYADEGGRLLLLTDPRGSADVKQIADHFGMTIGDDVVLDQVQRLFMGPTLGAQPMVRDYLPHGITQAFDPEKITIFNIVASVRSKGQPEGGATATEFARTGPTSWAETNLAAVFDADKPTAKFEKDGGDMQGPIPIAAAYEKKIVQGSASGGGSQKSKEDFDKTARVVVYGDSDWVLKSNLQAGFNRDLALNTVGWVVGESGGVSIRPRTMKTSGTQPLPQKTIVSILVLSLVIPEAILIFGLWVWWRRRSLAAQA